MSKKKLFKSKSNFTLKRLHQGGNYGNIYERDYTTIANISASPEGQIPLYGTPTFKLSVRGGYNGQKKYKSGEWSNNPTDDKNLWMLDNLPVSNNVDSKIIVKPSTSNLTDYAYFASASELIRATISNIITKYPAELYVTDKTVKNSGILESSSIASTTPIMSRGDYYIIDNPFKIDLTQETIPDNSIVSPLRYLAVSFDKYTVIDTSDKKTNITTWEIKSSREDNKCINNGERLAIINISGATGSLLTIECFYYEEELLYVTNKKGYRIRPNDSEVKDFFDNLGDFEKLLLNQYTDYTATFDTYVEDNELGWQVKETQYKWPTAKGDWNLSLNGKTYSQYVNSLSELAIGYDTLFSDVIWRNMTHEAIVNLDLTLSRNGDMVDVPNSSKLKMALSIFGRQFDEIKKYADNIKKSGVVSYDQSSNQPDYFLTDILEMKGWEVKNVLSTISNNIISEPMYGARSIGYTACDGNNEFMRRLLLNSKQIFSKKGTKQAIEELLAVFGLHSTDWIRRCHLPNRRFIRPCYYGPEDPSEKWQNTDSGIVATYAEYHLGDLWFNTNTNKSYTYSNSTASTVTDNVADYLSATPSGYYWLESNNTALSSEITDLGIHKDILSKAFEITETYKMVTGYQGSELKNFVDDVKKINQLKDTFDTENINNDDLLNSFEGLPVAEAYGVNENEKKVCRLVPWFDKDAEYDGKPYFQMKGGWGTVKNDKDVYLRTVSRIHYCSNFLHLNEIPYNQIDENGLYYIGKEDKYYKYDNEQWGELDADSTEVTDAENIIDNTLGNNPHSGDYDNGSSYYQKYTTLFKDSKFESVGSDKIENKDNLGFLLKNVNDSTKCIYLGGDESINNGLLRSKYNLKPLNLFNDTIGVDYSELAGTSIINGKELTITFDDRCKDFVENNVIHYLLQIIPSTTIFKYKFERLTGDVLESTNAELSEFVCDEGCPIYGIV